MKITIKPTARCLHTIYADGNPVGTIKGWRQMTTKHGNTGPGFTVCFTTGHVAGRFAYFDDARRYARGVLDANLMEGA